MVHLSHINLLAWLFCAQSIENSITAKNNKIMSIFLYTDMVNFWINDDNVRVSIVFFKFGLAISKCPRNRQPPGYHSDRTLCNWTTWSCKHYIVVLVDLSSSLQNSLLFGFLGRFVVIWDGRKLLAVVWRHDSSRVSSICNPYIVIYYQHYNCTGAWFVSDLNLVLSHKLFFSVFETLK